MSCRIQPLWIICGCEENIIFSPHRQFMSHTYAFMATALCPVCLDETGDIKVEHTQSTVGPVWKN